MKRFCAVILCTLFAVGISAADLKELLSRQFSSVVVTGLLEQGTVQNTVYRQKGINPTLVPSTTLAGEAVAFWKGDEAPFFIETLYLYKKTPQKQGLPGKDTDQISVILRSLSKLEGIEYYSNSRKKMRTLYEKSYIIDSPVSKKRLSDPLDGSADGISAFALQKDLTFGEYVYRYSWRQTTDSVAFFSLNVDAMSYSFFKLIQPDKLRVSLIVQDMGDWLLVYNLTKADFMAIPGIEGKITSSFSARADAIYKWFVKEYEKQ